MTWTMHLWFTVSFCLHVSPGCCPSSACPFKAKQLCPGHHSLQDSEVGPGVAPRWIHSVRILWRWPWHRVSVWTGEVWWKLGVPGPREGREPPRGHPSTQNAQKFKDSDHLDAGTVCLVSLAATSQVWLKAAWRFRHFISVSLLSQTGFSSDSHYIENSSMAFCCSVFWSKQNKQTKKNNCDQSLALCINSNESVTLMTCHDAWGHKLDYT